MGIFVHGVAAYIYPQHFFFHGKDYGKLVFRVFRHGFFGCGLGILHGEEGYLPLYLLLGSRGGGINNILICHGQRTAGAAQIIKGAGLYETLHAAFVYLA